MSFEDEFDYLNDDEFKGEEKELDAPLIKGSKGRKEISEADNIRVEDKKEVEEEDIEEKEEEKLPEKSFESVIYVVKVTTNKEDKAFEMITDRVNKKEINVYAVARPHGLRGYIFLEAPDRENAEEAVYNLPYVKGIIPQVVTYPEIRQMLEPVIADVKIEKSDIIEIISEPFKNEKAKVVRVDKQKGEVVVSLLGAAVPIPVTVKIDNVRVIRREDLEEE